MSEFQGEPEYDESRKKVVIKLSKTKGKGNKTRYVQIPELLDTQIRRFIKMFRKQLLPKSMRDAAPLPTDPVFPSSKTGMALSRT